jgi:hypothetical protein
MLDQLSSSGSFPGERYHFELALRSGLAGNVSSFLWPLATDMAAIGNQQLRSFADKYVAEACAGYE